MRVLGVIPARGGSVGIPNKNLVEVGGKPLIAWMIEAAKGVSLLERSVVVSSDSHDILDEANRHGAHAILRAPGLATAEASSESVLLDVLQHYHPEIVVLLQCTSPLTLPEDIDGTIRALIDSDSDCAVAVSQFHGFLWRRNLFDDSVNTINFNHTISRQRRQDRTPQYIETGAVYAMRTEGFLKAKHRFFGKVALYETPRERCLEIDEPSDLALAEAALSVHPQFFMEEVVAVGG